MKELALHILDIAENAVKADAQNIYIEIIEETNKDILKIKIKDDGSGIKEDILNNIDDPFTTTRKTRPVGMGIPLFKAAAERCNGSFEIKSNENGTLVKTKFGHAHIDRAPLGDIAQTIVSLILWDENLDLEYKHLFNGKTFNFDTKQIKKEIENVSIVNNKILNWIKEYISNSLDEIRGGEID